MAGSILGVHFYKGANIFQLMFGSNLFAVPKGKETYLCAIDKAKGGFAGLRTSLPEQHREALAVMGERFAAMHSQLRERDPIGLHTIYRVRTTSQGKICFKPEDALGVMLTLPLEQEVITVDFLKFDDGLLFAPALLAHTCQGYFKRLFVSGQGLMADFSAEYLSSQAAAVGLGTSREEVAPACSEAALILAGVTLDYSHDIKLLGATPEASQLLQVTETALNVDLPPTELEAVGQLPAFRGGTETAWGISITPIEAYRFLNRAMATLPELFPHLFNDSKLKGVSGFTYLLTSSGEQEILYTAIKNGQIEVAQFLRKAKPQPS